jgi:ABC-2 type transport system ATP-binding protein
MELEGLTKTYGRKIALQGVSLALQPGAIGLLGPNGAGKTTLLRAILGLVRLDRGEGRVLGLDLARHRLDIRQRTGFVPEDECLFPGLEGIEFVAYAGTLSGMSRSEALSRAHEMLDYVGLGEARYRRVETYSTGMKQRLKLAAAIVHDPKLLVLDEPTNGMDPAGRAELLALARDLAHAKGMSLILSSHVLPDVEAVCDRVVVMGRGEILANDQISRLKEHDAERHLVRLKEHADRYANALTELGVTCRVLEGDEVELELKPDQTLALAWQAAQRGSCEIRSLKRRQSSLEDVFLQAIRDAG